MPDLRSLAVEAQTARVAALRFLIGGGSLVRPEPKTEAERTRVTLDVQVSEGLACWCDRRGLYRVLSNLVDNAIT